MTAAQEFIFVIVAPLIIALIVINLFWFILAKVDSRFAYNPKSASLIAITFILLRSINYFALLIERATIKESPQQASQQLTPEQTKQEFLRNVEFLANNPTQYNNEVKARLFNQFKSLFPKGVEDIAVYRQEIGNAFLCQLSLNEDALNTSKTKKKVRSESTDKCSKLPGTFFGRPQLIPSEIFENHDKMLDLIVKKDKAAPAEKDLQTVVDQQRQRAALVQKIFE